jgi:O-antigen ligase
MTTQSALVSFDTTALTWHIGRRHYTALLLQPVLVVAAAMALVYAGRPVLAAQLLFLMVIAAFGYHAVRGDHASATLVLMGAINTMMFLRSLFLYTLPLVLLLAAVLLWVICSRGSLSILMRHPEVIALVACGTAYWWLSFLNTGDYSVNMRVLELCLTVCLIVLLGTRRAMLGVMLTAMGLCALLTGIATAPYGERLGMVEIGNIHIGNPIQLGLVTALVLVLCVADSGRWIFIPGSRLTYGVFAGCTAMCLALTTSRGSWLVAIAGLGAILVLCRRDRKRVLALGALAAILISTALAAGAAGSVEKYFLKVFGSDRTMAERTTLRSDQWMLVPVAFSEAPVLGHGPGSGRLVYKRYSGKGLDWHSLYLHVAVETGLLGLVCLTGILIHLLFRAWRHFRIYGEVVPITALACFLVIGFSVSGFDPLSGTYLGLACVSLGRRKIRFAAPASCVLPTATSKLVSASEPAV